MSCSKTAHIDVATVHAMFAGVTAQLRAARETLSALDAATGDGDHGTAMGKVAEALESTCATSHGDDLASFLDTLGWAVMGTDSGSTGPPFGSFFLEMSECISRNHLVPSELAKALESSLTKLRGVSKAEFGDKTLLDALIPAVEAIRAAANAGEDIAAMLHAGATAAAEGAAATKGLQAKFGRARHIGERSIGHVDPGATSVALLFLGFERGFSGA